MLVEYDQSGNVVWQVKAPNTWSAQRLDNGNTLITGDARAYVREINPKGETVWEFTQNDIPEIKLFNIQGGERLANGDTVFCNWGPNGDKDVKTWPQTVQVLEVTQQ
jgi:hypothetical protein